MRSFWTIVLFLGVLTTSITETRAQSKDVIEKLGITPPTLRVPEFQSYHLNQQLYKLHRIWKEGKKKEVDKFIQDLSEHQKNRGIRNFFAFATLLVYMGDKERGKENFKVAKSYYKHAADCAPDLAEPLFRLASVSIQSDFLAALPALRAFNRGMLRLQSSFLNYSVFYIQCIFYFLLACFLIFPILWFLIFLRRLTPFFHDLGAFFPQGLGKIQAWILVFLLVFLPLFVWGGILETLLCLVLVSWCYQAWSERFLTTIGLLVVIALPYMLEPAGKLLGLKGSQTETMYFVNESELSDKMIERLLQRVEKKPTFDLLWTLGLYYKRKGDLKTARQYLVFALKKRKDASILVNLGNIDFIEKKGVDAFIRYKAALKLKPRMMEAHYNLSLIFKHCQSTEVVDHKVQHLNAARGQNERYVEEFMKSSKKQINRYLMDSNLPLERYWSLIQKDEDKSEMLSFVWGKVAGAIPKKEGSVVVLGFLGLLWLLFPVARRFFKSASCERCGDMYNGKMNKHMKGEVCPECSKPGQKGDKRIERDIQIRRHQRFIRWSRFALAVVFPGGGYLYSGKVAHGFFILFMAGAYAALWLLSLPLVPHPFSRGYFISDLMMYVIGGVIALFYLQSLREAFREQS